MNYGIQISKRIRELDRIATWISEVGDVRGLDSVWTSESWGWEAFTPLAWMAAKTEHVRLCTGITAIPARTPTCTAMTAMTLDYLSNGRTVISLGVSGPRVAEGWYGQQFGKPLKRTREYMAVMRQAIRREGPLVFKGDYYQIPADNAHEFGLKSMLPPLRPNMPIFLGVQGPKNMALAAEIADGMLTSSFTPANSSWVRDQLDEGFRAAGLSAPKPNFEVASVVDVFVASSVHEAADQMRPKIVFSIAEMGSEGRNFYYDTFARQGFADLCQEIARVHAESGAAEAARLVPDEMAEMFALLGPVDKIREDLKEWESSVLDTLILRGDDNDVIDLLTAVLD